MPHELDDTLPAGPGDAPATPPLAVGELFAERYEIEAMVGRGGMGAVYRVRDVKLDETVALKLLTLSGQQAVERFLTEVRLARRVTHPNVARTHDFGERDGARFLTMEYVSGTTLEERLRRGPLTTAQLVEVGAAIADGLGAAHAVGIVHRDLKPANVLVEESGRVVITDFGIARVSVGAEDASQGALVGTPHYMAPEQVAGEPVDPRADLYALGVIVFELATGALPFRGDEPMEVAMARLRHPPPDPRDLGVTDDLATLILRCLSLDPAERPASASAIRQALVQIAPEAIAATAPTVSWPSEAASKLTSRSLFAPIARSDRAVAVLPFAYRGATDHDYLGEGLAEELIDILCRTKSLEVLALGATRKFTDSRDPMAMGEALGVSDVVDGTVQLAGTRVRLAARLVDTRDGGQRWTERFEGQLEDVFTLQESMARRVAEALRVEIDATAYRQRVPQRAIELYLEARKRLRTDIMDRALYAEDLLAQSLAIAPEFTVAIAAHAMAAVRAWWSGEPDADGRRAKRAYESVQRAIEQAPDLAETHQARAMLAFQDGAFQEAARALRRALEIAPTMTEAHHYLGSLQVEAGRVAEGRRRLERTVELDPTLNIAVLVLARTAVLCGDDEAFARHLDVLAASDLYDTLPVLVARFRWAMYRADRAEQERVRDKIGALGSTAGERMARIFGMVTGEVPPAVGLATLDDLPFALGNERFMSLMRQIAAEVLMATAHPQRALDVLEALANGILIDVLWLERCPLFVSLRDDARFIEVCRIVGLRAAEIWRR